MKGRVGTTRPSSQAWRLGSRQLGLGCERSLAGAPCIARAARRVPRCGWALPVDGAAADNVVLLFAVTLLASAVYTIPL